MIRTRICSPFMVACPLQAPLHSHCSWPAPLAQTADSSDARTSVHNEYLPRDVGRGIGCQEDRCADDVFRLSMTPERHLGHDAFVKLPILEKGSRKFRFHQAGGDGI